MYVGELAAEGLPDRLLSQAYCHAIDTAMDGRTVRVVTELASPTTAIVEYDVGMPLHVDPKRGHTIALLFLTLHAGCKNLKKHIAVGDEFCELGLAVMTALSELCEVQVVSNGVTACYRFRRGVLEHEPALVSTQAVDSTRMRIQLDRDCLAGNIEFSIDRLQRAVARIGSQIPSLTFSFS